MVPVIHGAVTDEGKLALSPVARELWRRHLASLAGQPVDVVVRVHRRQRSSEQNKYYWGVVVPLIGAYCGYDRQAMHDALAFRFLRIADDPITGSPRRQHTPETNTAEFSAYLEQCVAFAAELGVYVPAPGTVAA